MQIVISKDFSETLGGRYRDMGEYSAEEFRDDFLIPKFKESLLKGEKLLINFDGGYGYPVTFLEETFGGLKEVYEEEIILRTLEFVSEEEPEIIDEVTAFIKSPDRQTKTSFQKRKTSKLGMRTTCNLNK